MENRLDPVKVREARKLTEVECWAFNRALIRSTKTIAVLSLKDALFSEENNDGR